MVIQFSSHIAKRGVHFPVCHTVLFLIYIVAPLSLLGYVGCGHMRNQPPKRWLFEALIANFKTAFSRLSTRVSSPSLALILAALMQGPTMFFNACNCCLSRSLACWQVSIVCQAKETYSATGLMIVVYTVTSLSSFMPALLNLDNAQLLDLSLLHRLLT